MGVGPDSPIQQDLFAINAEQIEKMRRLDQVIDHVTKDVTKDVTKELPERQLVILQMISANASITISAMSQKTGVVIRTIKRDIENLQTSGCLTRKGGRKDGEWLLTELGLATLEKLKK